MNICYYDQRHISDESQTNLAADIARHMQSRQHLGKTVVICEKPGILLALTRKHWLKYARTLQKERSGTINAEKILRLTNTITHMHRMNFIARPPELDPRAHVYFVTPDELSILPVNTYSLYLAVPLTSAQFSHIQPQLPAEALIVGYQPQPPALNLTPKSQLEANITTAWQSMVEFMQQNHIDIDLLATPGAQQLSSIDDALDALLSTSRQFLQTASNLQHTLELSQPITLDSNLQRQYDILILLAHRVQALNPHSAFATRFTYDLTSDETFFLHDSGSELGFVEVLAQTIRHHQEAGRLRLARALHFGVPRF